ncbi:hypothetical protein ACGIF2_13110 [Cellulomonas sp. P22]|uniref:hypothetical protein n=1 Tax=Cellulomonas sp. P22 TaxID=3373189 RepID=UPI0037874BF0
MPRNASVVAGGTVAVLVLGVAAAAVFSNHEPERGPVGTPLVVTRAPEIDPAPRSAHPEAEVSSPGTEAIEGTEAAESLDAQTPEPDGPADLVPTSQSRDEPEDESTRDPTDGPSDGGLPSQTPPTDWWTPPTEPWWIPPTDGWWVPNGATPSTGAGAPATATSPSVAPTSTVAR